MKAFKIKGLTKNYFFNYLSITSVRNQRSPVNTGASATPLPLGYACYSFFETTPTSAKQHSRISSAPSQYPHRCRDSQKSWSATSPLQPNSQACSASAQGCGNFDTFSPQAWRGRGRAPASETSGRASRIARQRLHCAHLVSTGSKSLILYERTATNLVE